MPYQSKKSPSATFASLIVAIALCLASTRPTSAAITELGTVATESSFTQNGLTITPAATSAILPTDRHLFGSVKVVNNTDKKIESAYMIQCLDTNQSIPSFPQPSRLYLSPGESQTLTFFLDELHGRLNPENLNIGANTRTLAFSFAPPAGNGDSFRFQIKYDIQYFDREAPPGMINYTGTLVNENDQPVVDAFLRIYTPGIEFQARSNGQGQFTIQYPNNGKSLFRLRVEKSGYESLSRQIVQTESGSTLQMQSLAITQAPQGQLASTVSGNIGFWRGIASKTAQTVLLTNGMENWNGPNGDSYQDNYADASLFLYSIAPESLGQKLWTYPLGQEAWGASLSPDGAYAAVVTTGPAGSRSLDPGILTVIDASDGSKVWGGNIETLYGTSVTGDRLGSFCVQISSATQNRVLALGTSIGDFFLIDLLTGNLLHHLFLDGQVREVSFDDDDQYLYAGSGDGYLYKIETATGNIVWSAFVAGWPFVNGLRFSPDGNWIGVGSKNFFATIVNRSTGEVSWSHRMGGTVGTLAFSPDSSMVVAGSGGLTTAYRVSDGEELWTLPSNGSKSTWLDDGSFILINETFYTPGGTAVSDLGIELPGQSAQFNYLAGDGSIAVAAARDVEPGSEVLKFVTISLQPFTPEEDPGNSGGPGDPGNPGANQPTPTFAAFLERTSDETSFRLRFRADRDSTFQIEISKDLQDWKPLGEAIQGVPGTQLDTIQALPSLELPNFLRVKETANPPPNP